MISFIHGELAEIIDDVVVIDHNGIGYNVEVPTSILPKLPAVGNRIKLYTYLSVREDAMKLFGFLTRDDLEIFKMLIGVSGIGPKGGLSILSVMTPNDLRLAVMSGDDKAIAKAPGIGSKTAQKVIIEMKGKVTMPDFVSLDTGSSMVSGDVPAGDDPRGEAIAALVALGYSNSEAVLAVKKVDYKEGMDSEAVLKASLRNLTFL